MSYVIKFDSQFDADYEWLSRVHPELLDDLDDAVPMLRENGELPEGYRPHALNNASGNP
ncbi:hypothetical protein KIH79_12485 [Bifidobacterium sp. 82T10]|uniref:Uncharacterized protein n=1 Tax=Bifidobacterium miconis TaxID=2834435 RepID=A0ABS6WIX4_9BIFI|nr:type II toxin-antitoxin system YafQ family toxin [Bifidobacterium miconis]MBW3093715.1 hypothetical protein [Bifidobacterium miconis]